MSVDALAYGFRVDSAMNLQYDFEDKALQNAASILQDLFDSIPNFWPSCRLIMVEFVFWEMSLNSLVFPFERFCVIRAGKLEINLKG